MMSEVCKNCGRYFEPDGAECNDYGEVMYYTGDTDFCSSNCRDKYPEKQKREREEWEKKSQKESEERKKQKKYDNPRCNWCGKIYRRSESIAIKQGVYCSKRCEAKL